MYPTIEDVRNTISSWKKKGIQLVCTNYGFLHDGHASLIDQARKITIR